MSPGETDRRCPPVGSTLHIVQLAERPHPGAGPVAWEGTVREVRTFPSGSRVAHPAGGEGEGLGGGLGAALWHWPCRKALGLKEASHRWGQPRGYVTPCKGPGRGHSKQLLGLWGQPPGGWGANRTVPRGSPAVLRRCPRPCPGSTCQLHPEGPSPWGLAWPCSAQGWTLLTSIMSKLRQPWAGKERSSWRPLCEVCFS